MDGKGRFLDNIFIERLWRSLKYEDIFIRAYTPQGSPHSGRATGERKDSGERRMFAKRLEAMLPAVKLQKVRESHCA
jgi:hypothetical protein